MRRAPSRASSSRLIVSSLRAASSVTTLNMSRRSFLAGGGAPASFQHGQGGRYAAFSCQGLIHRFRRYLAEGTISVKNNSRAAQRSRRISLGPILPPIAPPETFRALQVPLRLALVRKRVVF